MICSGVMAAGWAGFNGPLPSSQAVWACITTENKTTTNSKMLSLGPRDIGFFLVSYDAVSGERVVESEEERPLANSNWQLAQLKQPKMAGGTICFSPEAIFGIKGR